MWFLSLGDEVPTKDTTAKDTTVKDSSTTAIFVPHLNATVAPYSSRVYMKNGKWTVEFGNEFAGLRRFDLKGRGR